MSWWKWLETQSSLPLPPPWIYIYIIYIICFFEIHCFLQAFVKKHQMDLSFYKMPLLYIFGKVMPNIFPVLRFHQYIYIYIGNCHLQTSSPFPTIDFPKQLWIRFKQNFGTKQKIRDVPFPPYHAFIYPFIGVGIKHHDCCPSLYMNADHADAHSLNDCAHSVCGITLPCKPVF